MPLSQHRPALAAILVAVVAVLPAFAATPANAAPSPSNPIVQRAMLDLGTYQGECWQFMKKVVLDATGSQVGFDYHFGYLEGGAVEVSVDEAGAGDIIQIVDDGYTAPDADYSGLHTAIIVAANGDGSFQVIDSNMNFDGMVNLRESYNPAAIAAGRGLNFHIYRFGEAPDRAQNDVPTVAGPVASGDTARINTPGDCLRLRNAPGGSITHCLGHNTRVTIMGAPKVVDGLSWVPVATPAGVGWMAADFLLKEAPPTAAPSAAGDVRPVFTFRAYMSVAAGE